MGNCVSLLLLRSTELIPKSRLHQKTRSLILFLRSTADKQLLKSIPWDWFQVAGRSQMWCGHTLKAGPNKEQPPGASRTLPGLYVEGDRCSILENRFGTSHCHMVSSCNLPIVLQEHEAVLFSLWFLLLFFCSEQSGGVYAAGLAEGQFSTQTSGSEGKSSFPNYTQTDGQTATCSSFPLKIQNPLLGKFCSHCPVSFP